MSNGYAGYAARREGKGQADIGAAVKEGVSQIQSTREKELTRRGELSDIYVASQTALKDIPTHQDDGINNWLQNSTTYIKKQMYDDFQLLKKGKISDNEYRTKHSNLLDAWKKFSTIAQNWNADTEAVLKGVEAGEDGELPALAQFSLFMLGEKDILTDYEKTTLTMGPNGYLSVARYVTEEEANDPAFKKENPGLKEGDMMGTAHELDKLVDPQNVISNYWDRAKNATAVTKDLAAQQVLVKGEDGKLRVSSDAKARDTYDEIKSNAIEAQTSVDRTVANAATSMKLATGFYATEKKRKEMINETMNSGSVRRTIKDRTEELIGEGKVDKDALEKRTKEIHTEAKNAKKVMTLEEARELALEEFKKSGLQYDEAEAQARKEAYGRAAMQLIKASKNDKSIWQPLFDEGGSIVAEEDMIISYREWNPEDGETYPRTEHIKKGDTVPIGKYQKKNVEAQMSQDIDTYAGGKITKDPAQGRQPPPPKPPKDPNEVVDIYNPVIDIMRFDEEAIKNVIADASNNISNIEPKTTQDGKVFLEITDKKGDSVNIDYVYDSNGDLNEKDTALRIAKAIYKYKDTEDRFQESKKIHGKKEVDPKKKVIEATEHKPYYDLTDPKGERGGIPFTWRGTTGSISKKQYKYEDKLQAILEAEGPGKGKTDLLELLQDLTEGKPDLSQDITIERTGTGNDVILTVEVGGKKIVIPVDPYFDKSGDELVKEKKSLKKKINEILEAHHGVGGKPKASKLSVGDVKDGWRYLGGDEKLKTSWEKVK